jgi:hypothetical protein
LPSVETVWSLRLGFPFRAFAFKIKLPHKEINKEIGAMVFKELRNQ